METDVEVSTNVFREPSSLAGAASNASKAHIEYLLQRFVHAPGAAATKSNCASVGLFQFGP
jgi:hypothetical protein